MDKGDKMSELTCETCDKSVSEDEKYHEYKHDALILCDDCYLYYKHDIGKTGWMSKFIDKIKIELREMKGYDISDIDLRWYTHDRITQEIERFQRILNIGEQDES